MTYRVILFRRAKEDVRKILRWLQKRSPDGMVRWRDEFYKTLDEIAADPSLSSAVSEGTRLPAGLKQWLFSTRQGNVYRIVFLIEREEIWVLRVRGPGQRPLRMRDLRGD
jgi:plasmid stabilization system protein ParE